MAIKKISQVKLLALCWCWWQVSSSAATKPESRLYINLLLIFLAYSEPMDATASRSDAMQVASTLVTPLISKVTEQAKVVHPGTVAVVTFMIDALRMLDHSVSDLIGSSTETGLINENQTILEAYYDAIEKAKSAALNIMTHVTDAIVEVSRLLAVIESKGDAEAQALALEELELVNTKQLNLPIDILDDMEKAQAAYAKVISLCDEYLKQKRKSRSVMACMVFLIGITAGVVLTTIVGPPVLVFGLGVGVETTFVLGSFAAASAAGVVSSVAVKRICELQQFLGTMKQQRDCVHKAWVYAGGIIFNMVQVKVERVQTKLKLLCSATGTAQRLKRLAELQETEFVEEVKKQLKDLRDLRKTCDDLIENVLKAYDSFQRNSNAIVTISAHALGSTEREEGTVTRHVWV